MSSLISLAISIFSIVCLWFVFEKAGEEGWKSLIPIYNGYVLAKIANRKWTFWVQFICTIVMSALIIFAIIGTFVVAGSVATDMPDIYDGYEDYSDDYYYDYEDDYITSEISNANNTHSIENLAMSDVYIDDEQLTEEEAAALEESVDEMLEELGPAIGIMIAAIIIPLLFILPLMAVNLCQHIGLSKAFGMHWAFSLVLLFFNPVGMGILAFSNEIRYVGATGTPAPTTAAAGTASYNAESYRPVETIHNDNRSSDYNPYEPSTSARVAPDVSEKSEKRKYACPNCGYESEVAPNPDTFCPNCGHLHR